jgi:hypothetical protein
MYEFLCLYVGITDVSSGHICGSDRLVCFSNLIYFAVCGGDCLQRIPVESKTRQVVAATNTTY